jgi:hypothetical protein
MRTWMKLATLPPLVAALAACGGQPEPAPAPEAPPPAAEAPAAAEPAATPAPMPRTPAPAGAKVTITSPANGAVVKSPVTVTFAIEGMTLAAAGVNDPNTGHHHVLVDADIPALDQPIPKDANHVHFGQAQTEGTIELAPGQHTLQLLLGDGNHVPHDPPVASDQITITVE